MCLEMTNMLRNTKYGKKYQICYEITIGLRNRGERRKNLSFFAFISLYNCTHHSVGLSFWLVISLDDIKIYKITNMLRNNDRIKDIYEYKCKAE